MFLVFFQLAICPTSFRLNAAPQNADRALYKNRFIISMLIGWRRSSPQAVRQQRRIDEVAFWKFARCRFDEDRSISNIRDFQYRRAPAFNGCYQMTASR
jgi:hypothetical protein